MVKTPFKKKYAATPERAAAVARAGIAARDVYKNDEPIFRGIAGEEAPRLAAINAATSPAVIFPSEVTGTLQAFGQYRQAGIRRKKRTREQWEDLIHGLKKSGKLPLLLPAHARNLVRSLEAQNPGQVEQLLSGPKVEAYRLGRLGEPEAYPADRHIARVHGVSKRSLSGTVGSDPVTGEKNFARRTQAHEELLERAKETSELLNTGKSGSWGLRDQQAAQWGFLRALLQSADATPEGAQVDLKSILRDLTHERVARGTSFGSIIFGRMPNGDHTPAYKALREMGLGRMLPKLHGLYLDLKAGSARTGRIVDGLSGADLKELESLMEELQPLAQELVTKKRGAISRRKAKAKMSRILSRRRYAAVSTPKAPAPAPLNVTGSPALAPQPATMPAGPNLAAPQPSPEDDHKQNLLAFSPNIEEGLTFEDAVARARSGNQKAFKQIIKHVNEQVGLKANLQDAIGDWSDGAENSILQRIDDPVDPKTVDYLAAWYGLLGNQKSVLAFSPAYNGTDSVYTIDSPETDMSAIREALSQAGIPFRTLVPSKKGTKIIIYDQGRELRDKVAQFASHHHADVRESIGKGRFLGGDTRTAARSKFRKIITSYEAAASKPGPNGSSIPTYKPPVLPHHVRTGGEEGGNEKGAGPKESRPNAKARIQESRHSARIRLARRFTREEARAIVEKLSAAGLKVRVVGSVEKKGNGKDLDLLSEVPLQISDLDSHLNNHGYERTGQSLLSPKEAASSRKPFLRGMWSKIHHYRHPLTGQGIDIFSPHDSGPARVQESRPARPITQPRAGASRHVESARGRRLRYATADYLNEFAEQEKAAKPVVTPLERIRNLARKIVKGTKRLGHSALKASVNKDALPHALKKSIFNDWEHYHRRHGLPREEAPSAEKRQAKALEQIKPTGTERLQMARRGGVKAPANGVIVRGMFYPGGKFIPSANLEKAKYDQYQHVEAQRARYARGDIAGALRAEAEAKENQ